MTSFVPRASHPFLTLTSALLLSLGPACSSDPVTGAGGAGTGGHGAHTGTTTSSTGTGTGAGGEQGLPETFLVTGIVTDGESPVEGAIVMQAGGSPALLTGADGAYSIELSNKIVGIPAVVAAKVGYRTAGIEFYELPTEPVDLEIRFVSAPDNPKYIFGDPGIGDEVHDNSTAYCGHCHTTQTKQFQSSAHAKSARNPFVQDLYAGVSGAAATETECTKAGGIWRAGLVPGTSQTTASKCYLGGGVLPDLNPTCGGPGKASCDDPALDPLLSPKAFGRCADCHAAGIDGVAGGRNLHDAVGVSFEHGDHCDVCHHIRDVDLSLPPGVGGALMMQRSRDHLTDNPTSQLVQVLYGPLLDVPNTFMGGSYQPKFTKSEFCGGCHEQRQEALIPGTALDPLRWPGGLPTHSTFSEWENSSLNQPKTQCQNCHMPPDDAGLKSSLDVTDETNASITYGYLRTPEQLRKHTFRGPLSGMPRYISQAMIVSVSAAIEAGELIVTASLQNQAAGHAIPTGEPLRSLLIVVRAEACGKVLRPSGGATLDDWGGAFAEGTVGADAQVNGAALSWAEGAATAKAGQVIRAVRPTGMFEDYAGIGFFADPALSPLEKGIELHAPVGEATVVNVVNGVIALSQALTLQIGDRLYLGDAASSLPLDGSPSAALAGSAGHSFARTLLDPQGRRGVPHYQAVDMQSDNRIGPGAQVVTVHPFPLAPGCATAKVSAAAIYRPLPLALGRERGWKVVDWVIAEESKDIALP